MSARSDSDPRRHLRADCTRCFGLCCVAPAFTASADFAIDKEPGQPCPHLGSGFRCDIHDRLRPRGFPGCAAYDCFGAGQTVAQLTFGGRSWQESPALAEQMFAVFEVMRHLHEALWHLTDALRREPTRPLHGPLRRALEETEAWTRRGPDTLAGLDTGSHRQVVGSLLERASRLVRAGSMRPETDLRGADLAGRRLRGADLAGADLRGACLIRADLRGADLSLADVLGADLRGADLRGADAASALFLTRVQVHAARGDPATRLPPALDRPGHWPTSGV